MGTLTNKTPANEYLTGFVKKKDKYENTYSKGKMFKYRNFSDDQSTELESLSNMQQSHNTNIIYTSYPIDFSNSDLLVLEDQPNERKIKEIIYDSNKKTDLRLKNVKNKTLYLGKIIYLK